MIGNFTQVVAAVPRLPIQSSSQEGYAGRSALNGSKSILASHSFGLDPLHLSQSVVAGAAGY